MISSRGMKEPLNKIVSSEIPLRLAKSTMEPEYAKDRPRLEITVHPY
jgi:hypothetical protein